jgi:tRNA threonylcarbamoyladenosine biosynthesis protein TsaE
VSVHITGSEAETSALGRELAARVGPGAVVLLEGPLGAGKTAFVRGIAEGLGGSGDAVSSPTFTIVQEYRGPIVLQHVDLYRLNPAEVDDLALEDLMEDSVLAVEWPDRWRRAPSDAIVVTIAHEGGDHRRITINTTPGVVHRHPES